MNQELTIKQEIDQRLVAAGVTEEVIAGLEKLADEHDNEITSQEQFKAVDRARKDIKEVRLVGVNNAEAIHERAKQLWQQSKSIVNDLTRRLKAPEGRLQARVDEWEFKIQQQKEAEAKAFQAEVQARNNSLMSLGYILMDGVWTLDGVSVDAEVVLKETHHQWNEIRFPQLRMHGEEVAAAKAEAVRLQEQEAERLRKEKQGLEAREAALKEREDALREARQSELRGIGCIEFFRVKTVDGVVGTVPFIGVHEPGVDKDPRTEASLESVRKMTDPEYKAFKDECAKAFGEMMADQAARQAEQAAVRARQELINTRVAALTGASWLEVLGGLMLDRADESDSILAVQFGEIYDMPQDQFDPMVAEGLTRMALRQAAKEEAIRQQERERLAKEQADRELAEQLEAEQRIALYGDSEHIRHCMELLKHAGSKMTEILPSIKTQAIRDKVSANRDMLRQMYVELNALQQ